jgi:putative PEP-CTERM system TPR-repeat lipoprotein
MQKTMRRMVTLAAVSLLVLAGAGCTAKAKKAYHQSRANRFYNASQFDRAEIEYLGVLRYDPENSQAYGRLGLIYYEQGRLQRALYFLSKGSQMATNDLNLRLKLGFIYSSAGQSTQALAQANFILGKRPLDDEAPLLLAEAAIQPKDVEAIRQRLQTMARSGDRAAIEVALGNLALRERDLATASADYKRAQALDPKSITVNAALAALAWAQGDLKLAETLFKTAADASPIRSPHRMQYVRFKIQAGDPAGARAALTDILKAAPDYLPASMVLAEIAASEKKYDECAGLLDKVLALDAGNFDAMLFEGQLDLVRNQPDKAVTDMERMAHVYPQVARVHYQLGSAYAAGNDLVKATASLTRALELNPNLIEATLLLAEIQIRNANAAPAILALERLREKQPRLAQAQLLLADAYRLAGRLNDALAIYRTMEAAFPTNAQVPLLRGATLLQVPDKAAARTAFERVLELSPGHLPAIEQLVDLDLGEKQFDAAMQLVSGEVQKDPKRVELRILSAKIFTAQGKRDQAEAALQQAIELAPDNLGAFLLLAQLYSDAGQSDKAMAKLDAVLAKDSQNTSALMLAAKIYNANKNYQGAADAYEKLLKIDPRFSPALNNLAYLYLTFLNNTDRAYALAQQARELLPFDPSTADTLGWACYKKGSYQTALGLLQESAGKLPEEPEVQFHLGMASYMTGDEAAARAALQQALKSGADFPDRDEGRLCMSILDIKPDTADAAARAMLEKRIAEKTDDTVALVRLARICQREGNAGKAIAAYEAILQAMPKNLDAMVNLTRFYAAKDPKKAYDMAKAANKLAPYDLEVAHVLGRLAFQSGDYSFAANLLQQTSQGQPNDASLLFDYAQAAYSVGKTSEAQAALQSALNLNLPAAQAAQARRIFDLIGLAANPAQAAAAGARIADILKSEPDDVPALMARAAACEFKTDAAGAEQAGEKILERYPDFTPAQKQLARLYATDPAKLDRAYALASKARETFPDDPALAKIAGVILVQRGDYSRAVNLLKQSAAKINTDAEVFYYLGSAQFHLKNRTESKASLQQALALKLSGPPAEAAKQMLSELM